MRIKGNHSNYEKVFNDFLRKQSIPTLPTHEVKKAIDSDGEPLKNFDVLLMSDGLYSIDVKGKNFGFKSAPKNKYENWVLEEDPHALLRWEKLFKLNGSVVKSLFVFIFKINFEGDDLEFKDVIVNGKQKYGVMAICPEVYLSNSKPRSNKPKSVNVSRRLFKNLAKPLSSFIPALDFSNV